MDMKTLKEKDLSDIQVIHDKVNHSLTDARYWRKHANPTKASEAESRYKQFASELIDMKNRLVELKEEKFPEYLSNWTRAQLEFYRRCSEVSTVLDDALRKIGPVPITHYESFNPNFDLGTADIHDDGEAPSPTSTPTPAAGGPPPINPAGPPPLPSHAGIRARANYPFTAAGPEELSFNSGDVLTVSEQNGDWWRAELNGRNGLVPSNYLTPI